MAKIVQFVEIGAPLEVVWREASDLASHVEWMADAERIEFETDQREGVGTVMRVETVVGPLRTSDVMEITEWVDHQRIGVRHKGLVTGTGEFQLVQSGDGTRFTWTEELTFPMWLGGPITAFLAKPVLGLIWRRNLVGLKRRIES